MAAINRAEPGLIRVDADETTYSLHIMLRFDLERQLIEETLAPKDLPEAWNAGMKELLGVDVPDDARGVLQDVHWSSGGIGYFPTYALGNVISLQIWAAVREALPDLDAQLEAGDLGALSAWLRDNLYSLGRKLTPKETIERVTGSPRIDPGAVSRVPPRKTGRTACTCLTSSSSSSTASRVRSQSSHARFSFTRSGTTSGSRARMSGATRASAAPARSCSTGRP